MDGMLCALDHYMRSCDQAYLIERQIELEMRRVKKNALLKIETIVNPKHASRIATALCKAYHEGSYDAEFVLIYELELTDEEIYALEDNFERYKAHFQKNYKVEESEDGYSF